MFPMEAILNPPSRGSRLDADHPRNGVLIPCPIHNRQKEARAAADPCQPLALRAVPVAAGIVGDAQPAAVIVLLDVTAQCCRAAAFDGAHNTALAAAQMAGMGLTVR